MSSRTRDLKITCCPRKKGRCATRSPSSRAFQGLQLLTSLRLPVARRPSFREVQLANGHLLYTVSSMRRA